MNRLDRLRGRYGVQAEPLKTERRTELLLLCLGILVILQLFWMGLRAAVPGIIGVVLPATDSLMVQEVANAGLITAQDSLVLQSRPLFWGSRRPIEAAPAPRAKDRVSVLPAGGLKNLRVLGVYGAGDAGGAIVTYKGDQRRLVVGDVVDGWTLVRVGHGEAVWSSGKGEDVRRLLPQPVLEAFSEAAEVLSAPIEEVPDQAINDALPTEKKLSSNRVERTLSFGGLPPAQPDTSRKREK